MPVDTGSYLSVVDKGRVKKKSVENSTLWWMGGSGVGQYPQKNMTLKSILDHFKSF